MSKKDSWEAEFKQHICYHGTMACEFCQSHPLLSKYGTLLEQCEECWWQKEFEKNGYQIPKGI